MTRTLLALVAIVAAFVIATPATLADDVIQIQGDGNIVVAGGSSAYVEVEGVSPIYVERSPIYIVEPIFVVPVERVYVERRVVVRTTTTCCKPPSCLGVFATPVCWGPCGRFFCDTNRVKWTQEAYRPLPRKPSPLTGRLSTGADGVRRFTAMIDGQEWVFKEAP